MTSDSESASDRIDEAIAQVQRGELTPAQAAERLVASECDPVNSSPAETLASSIARLGSPPRDVIEVWCRKLQQAAAVYERETSQPFPAIDLERWTIDSYGQLTWREFPHAFDRDEEQGKPEHPQSIEHIDQFRRRLLGEQLAREEDGSSSPLPATLEAGQLEVIRAPRYPTKRTGALVVAVATTLGLIFFATRESPFFATRESPEEVAQRSDRSASASESVPEAQTFNAINSDQTPQSNDLETFESMVAMDPEVNDPLADSDVLTLDLRMPAAGDLLDQANAEVESSGESVEMSHGRDDARSEESDALADDDAQPPEEAPQETRLSTATVELTPVGDTDTPTLLSDASPKELQLAFPFDVPLEMTTLAGHWLIRDTRNDLPIAKISGGDPTEFQWVTTAKQSPNATSLVHGRLIDEAGNITYLRPSMKAEPWSIRLDASDVRPTWDLRQPIPPRVSRLTVEFQLPDEIELGWIEPIDPEEIRRCRGLAVLTPKDHESVAVGMRLDVRCGRKLSCRMRFAARLDPAMPWQMVTGSSLVEFADRLSEQAAAVSREKTRLDTVYQQAGSQGRQVLRIKQQRNDAQAERISETLERVAQLQTLISRLETDAALRFRITVQWPTNLQTILAMEP